MVKAIAITDIGKRRKLNQDYVFQSTDPIGPLPNIFIVADGMGGHNAGDYASKYTVETLEREIKQSSDADAESILGRAISEANYQLREISFADLRFFGMGTTVVAASIDTDKDLLKVANVGDSRLYVDFLDGIRQVTRDHSWVEEMVQNGTLDKKMARVHPDKNVITRAVGAMDYVEPDFFEVKLKEGDIILLCTDGLTNMLEDWEIHDIIRQPNELKEKGERLVHEANERGGGDNISVILIDPFA